MTQAAYNPRVAASFEVRARRFAVREAPRHWHGGRRSVTSFLDALSTTFPPGERFFMRAVQRFRKSVTDPKLRADMAAFAAQEGAHNRVHEQYNEARTAHGYPADKLEAGVDRLLARVEKIAPPRLKLAATAALEHFTATLGETMLRDPRMLEGADPAMAALWRWHALEESEHKSVAFDVFLAADGTYGERMLALALAAVILSAKMLQFQAILMKTDGTRGSLAEWRALGRFLFLEPGMLRPQFFAILDYMRPGFHPSDRDDPALREAWQAAEAEHASAAAN